MDRRVHTRYHGRMQCGASLTPKGSATRARIVEAAADLVLARGFAGTTLDDIRAGTATSKSQLFHYFPGGKSELIEAIASFQGERVLEAQRPYLDTLDTWEVWQGWRDAVVAHYGSQPHWGCPISALASELLGHLPAHADAVARYMDLWRAHLVAGVARMRAAGLLRSDTDPEAMGLSIFAALQGGLMLTQAMRSIAPLEAALDGAMAALRSAAPSTPPTRTPVEGRRATARSAARHREAQPSPLRPGRRARDR
jgi:AcrR family transcriptional regulator